MPSGHVLVIEDDGVVSLLLANAIRGAGFEVTVTGTARGGLDLACTARPDCIVCDITLPDNDGFWVAKNVRTHPSSVSVTPFLFLSGLADHESRLAGFHVGADVYMTKPFRTDEVIAQVCALVQMAARLRGRRDSLIILQEGPRATAIEADLSQMSVATLLTVLELERRTGSVEVESKRRRARLELSGGHVAEGMVGETRVSALMAVRTMLGWKVGRFSFTPAPARDAPRPQKSIASLLLEAARLQDEDARLELDLPPVRQRTSEPRIGPPVLGGPPSSPCDFAPPSSRSPMVAAVQQAALELEDLSEDLTDGWEEDMPISSDEPPISSVEPQSCPESTFPAPVAVPRTAGTQRVLRPPPLGRRDVGNKKS
jgi:two-component system, OmpR family, response regulator